MGRREDQRKDLIVNAVVSVGLSLAGLGVLKMAGKLGKKFTKWLDDLRGKGKIPDPAGS